MQVLSQLTAASHPQLLVGTETKDDAAVYRLNKDTAIVQTVDVITPIVDDPFVFGSIAFANAVSDIYAMGAVPFMGLNIMGFPVEQLPMDIMVKIFQGAQEKAKEAECLIVGGHTIDDTDLKYGLCVSGFAHPDAIYKNSTAKEGDVLILTKPLGLGIVTTAIKKGKASPAQEEEAVKIMTTLNKAASECAVKEGVSAMTDVTGFGLLGHLSEMTTSSNAGAVIYAELVPLIEGTIDFAQAALAPGGAFSNQEFVLPLCKYAENISEETKIILCDPQTSGGLLIACPKEKSKKFLDALHRRGVTAAVEIGEIIPDTGGKIFIR